MSVLRNGRIVISYIHFIRIIQIKAADIGCWNDHDAVLLNVIFIRLFVEAYYNVAVRVCIFRNCN
ncbi:hypothetical protein D3C76_1407280 [compost metagenome]